MNEYEILSMEIEFLTQEIGELAEELNEKKELRRQMEESMLEDESPFWTADDPSDPLHGRYNKQVNAIKAALLAGNRAERYYAKVHPTFNNKIITTLAERKEDISPEFMELYNSEQTENLFPIGWGGRLKLGYYLDAPNAGEDGAEVSGYLFLWGGNYGPIAARKSFEQFWADPNQLENQRKIAERRMRSADFYYKIATMTRTVEDFLAKHPHYEPLR
jgi:hypothetical protein